MIQLPEINKRAYLPNYDLVLKIKEFFVEFVGDVSEYEYVSATERRCFNLASIFLPKIYRKNLLSNNGLLQYHRELVEYYTKKGHFPRILILDDLMIHGRGMSKFLYQLETLIEEDLNNWAKNDMGQKKKLSIDLYLNFRHRLIQSVDLVVFARNERPLLLDDRYRYCLKSAYVLSEMDLHDLSWQLSDSLTHWQQANTCFEYSEHNESLWNMLVQKQEIQKIMSNGWQQIHWNYDNESMEVFLGFRGRQKATRISSIRIFPGREKQKWFTSFSMLGTISSTAIQDIGGQIAGILRKEDTGNYDYLICLLTSEETCAIEQMLAYFLSVLDYRSFLKSIPDFEYHMPDAEWILTNTDIMKVCRNFGKEDDVLYGLAAILSSENVMNGIDSALRQRVEWEAGPICQMPKAEIPDIDLEIPYSKYNEHAEKVFYSVGIDAEEGAARLFYNVEVFRPASFQEYSRNSGSGSTDGIISLCDFFEKPIFNLDCTQSEVSLYYHTAALLHIMDYGLMGIRIWRNESSEQLLLCKAGEMATFYGPKKIAVAVPAMAMLEKSYGSSQFTPRELIEKFFASLEEEDIKGLIQVDYATWERECHETFRILKEEISQITGEIYRGDQHYTEWNFENLTTMQGTAMQRFQRALEYLVAVRV